MNVRMLTHYSRAADGLHVTRYISGQKYDLPESEARLFIEIGVAIEDKDMGRAPEVKEDGIWQNDSTYPFAVRVDTPETKQSAKRRRK